MNSTDQTQRETAADPASKRGKAPSRIRRGDALASTHLDDRSQSPDWKWTLGRRKETLQTGQREEVDAFWTPTGEPDA